jgi:integrase
MPRVLTDAFVRSLQPAPTGQRYGVADALVPGFGVRVTNKGSKSYILWKRLRRGAKSASALSLGKVGELTLAEARGKARIWIAQIQAGNDPRITERTERDQTFAAVMENYLARHVRGRLRKAPDVEREMRTELLARWRDRPVTTITRREIIAMIDQIKDRGAVYQAHNILGHCKTFFGWCVERDILEHSPADHINRSRLIGVRKPRQRVLIDDEIRAFWGATEAMGYPYGTAFKLLLLTGQRRGEVVEASWPEFDLGAGLWTIPRERFKSDCEHLVPLSDAATELLATIPRWSAGEYLFSFCVGRAPLQNFSTGKRRLDELMGNPPLWVTHDLRRTMRTGLAALRIADNVAEQIIGHGKRGLQRVYDQHKYLNEMRAALEAWALALEKKLIVPPPRLNVVSLR